MIYSSRAALLDAELPGAFLRELVQALARLYHETFDATEELPLDYQRYLRPHALRTKAEIAFLTLARRHGLICRTKLNPSQDAHAVIVTDRLTVTLSRTQGPNEPPRWARFRVDYSKVSQYRLPSPDFEVGDPPIMARDDAELAYIVISHGPTKDAWRDLGWVTANFMAEHGTGYVGQGIDLLAYLAGAIDQQVEEVQEPEVRSQDDEEAEDSGEAS